MKFSFEVPLLHLDDFSDLQDYIFALSFLLKDKRYVNYLKQEQEDGRYLILDNSYNELKIPNTSIEMLTLFKEIKADAVIAPDCDIWTLNDYEKIWKEMSDFLHPSQIFMVARNPEHFLTFEEWGVWKIAIPYEFRPEGDAKEGYTEDASIHLRQSHFLGLNTVDEPIKYQANSCDTSMPIKLALNKMTMEDWVYSGHKHIDTNPEFFDLILTETEINLARENILFLKGVNFIK